MADYKIQRPLAHTGYDPYKGMSDKQKFLGFTWAGKSCGGNDSVCIVLQQLHHIVRIE